MVPVSGHHHLNLVAAGAIASGNHVAARKLSHLAVNIGGMKVNSVSRLDGVEALLALRAGQQHGAVSRSQALAAGLSDSTMQRRVASGRWRRPHPGVYVIGAMAPCWTQDVWSAYLAVGPAGVVSHESALHLHGLHQLSRRPITLTVPHGGHARLDRVFVHQIDDLKACRVTKVEGLPTTTPERTLVDLASSLGDAHLSRVVDDALAAKLSTCRAVAACFREVLRPGKPGLSRLARVLDQRGEGDIPPQSELERALLAVLDAAGLPRPSCQHPLPGSGGLGLVDAAYTQARVLLEADGRRWHARIENMKLDRRRDTRAARAGWLTLRFMYEDIVHNPDDVSAAVADVLNNRGILVAGPS